LLEEVVEAGGGVAEKRFLRASVRAGSRENPAERFFVISFAILSDRGGEAVAA
jgi:hypothetical protein